MEKEELKDIQLATNDTILELVKLVKQSANSWRKTCMTLIVAIVVICAMFAGSWLYFISTYEVEIIDTTTTTYEQSSDGESRIINGNSYNDNSVHNVREE